MKSAPKTIDYPGICRRIFDVVKADKRKVSAAAYTEAQALAVMEAQLRLEIPPSSKHYRPKRTPRVNGRDPIFDAIATAAGIDLSCITRAHGGRIATAKRDILEASPNVTPAEIAATAAAYRRAYRDAPCTPTAIASHWAEFAKARRSANGSAPVSLYTEPTGWRETLRKLYPTASSIDEKCAGTWLELATYLRQEIVEASRTA